MIWQFGSVHLLALLVSAFAAFAQAPDQATVRGQVTIRLTPRCQARQSRSRMPIRACDGRYGRMPAGISPSSNFPLQASIASAWKRQDSRPLRWTAYDCALGRRRHLHVRLVLAAGATSESPCMAPRKACGRIHRNSGRGWTPLRSTRCPSSDGRSVTSPCSIPPSVPRAAQATCTSGRRCSCSGGRPEAAVVYGGRRDIG